MHIYAHTSDGAFVCAFAHICASIIRAVVYLFVLRTGVVDRLDDGGKHFKDLYGRKAEAR